MFVCCRCFGDETPRRPDGWLPGVGAVCAEHAAEAWAAGEGTPAELVERRAL